MFEKILGRFKQEKQEEHPLASDAGLDRLIADFPADDAARILFELAQWLDGVERFAGEVTPLALRHAVMRLDDFARPAYGTLYARFMTPGAKEHLSEQTWALLDAHCSHVHNAHRHLLGAALTNPDLAQDPELLTRSAARGMLAWISRKKLLRYRYRVAGSQWWRQANEMLALARKLKVHKTAQRLYMREDLCLSARQLYVVGVYLEMAPLGNLAHPQIEAFERFLMQNSSQLEMLRAPGPASTHRLNLKAAGGPVLMGDHDAGCEDSLRYCSGRSLRARLIALATELRGETRLPAWVATIPCTREQMQGLIRTLLFHWSDAPPKREAARHGQTARLLVLHGFALARAMLDSSRRARDGTYGPRPAKPVAATLVSQDLRLGQTSGFTIIGDTATSAGTAGSMQPPATPLEALERLEKTLVQWMEHWRQTDASDTGLGALVPGLSSIYGAGGLMCYRQEHDIEWRLGIIRRIAHNADGDTSIGVEKLPGPSRCAIVTPMAERAAAGTLPDLDQSGSRDAILVADVGDEILLPAGKFVAGETLLMQVEGEPRGIRLTELLDEDEDYQRVRFAPMTLPTH